MVALAFVVANSAQIHELGHRHRVERQVHRKRAIVEVAHAPFLDRQLRPPQGAPVIMNYQVVNSGHQDTSKIENTLDQTADKLIDMAATKFNSSNVSNPSDGDPSSTGLNDAGHVIAQVFVSLAGYFLKAVSHAGVGMLFANCDGPVAIDTITIDSRMLGLETLEGTHRETRHYPGFNTPHGCGSNSSYNVTWSVTRTSPVTASLVELQLIKSPTSPAIYVVENGQRHWIPSPEILNARYGARKITTLPDQVVNQIPKGADVGMPAPGTPTPAQMNRR